MITLVEVFCATQRHQKTKNKKTNRRQRFAWLYLYNGKKKKLVGTEWVKDNVSEQGKKLPVHLSREKNSPKYGEQSGHFVKEFPIYH